MSFTYRCAHEYIEACADRTPSAVAATFDAQDLTYQELNSRANQLAHHLREAGVGPDVLVGLCVERSFELLIGLVAILKAGGAFLPIDPRYPLQRLAFMLADALPLLEAFRTSVELSRTSPRKQHAELRGRVHRAVATEQELVVDPAFFLTLLERIAEIAHAARRTA